MPEQSHPLGESRPIDSWLQPEPILIIGRDGQVGRALADALAPLGKIVLWGRGDFSLGDIMEKLDDSRPSAIINAAAWTKVELAESRPAEAREANATMPAFLGKWAAKNEALVIHYSTDYVFDGQKNGAYLETDTPAPLNVYGQTKLEGDLALLESGAKALIFRTSWVYSIFGQNFPKTILNLAQKHPELTVNNDQKGAPTSAELIAQVTAVAAAKYLSAPESLPTGIYNLAASGHTTWRDYALTIISRARDLGFPISPNLKINSCEGPDPQRPARRPLNSRLDASKLEKDFRLFLPGWEYGLERLLSNMRALAVTA